MPVGLTAPAADDDHLIIALYDIETAVSPPDAGGWGDHDRHTFACGIVRWVRYVRRDNVVYRRCLAQSVYWSPVAMCDDLLRPDAHLCMAFNGHRFDVPTLAYQAVPEAPGVYLADPTPAQLAQARAYLASLGIGGEPGIVRPDHDPAQTLPATPPPFRGPGLAAWHARVCEWIERAQEAGYSRLVPTGAAGLGWSRGELIDELTARTLDPLAIWGEQTGHPHLTSLEQIRLGLNPPGERDRVAAPDVGGAEVPRLWSQGRRWACVAKCAADVEILEHLLHQAFSASRLYCDYLNETTPTGAPSSLSGWGGLPGGVWRWHIPTDDWWARCLAIKGIYRG